MSKNKKGKPQRRKKREGACEVCGYEVLQALNIHHLTLGRDRVKGEVAPYMVLCANCHHILHSELGWSYPTSATMNKEGVKNTIARVLGSYK